MGQGSHEPQHQAEAVEQWHRQAEPVGLGEFLSLADMEAVVEDVVVGEHHPLGKARGPRGVLHIDHLVAGEARRGPRQFLVAGVGAEKEKFLRVVHAPMLLRPDEDHALQPRKPRALESASLAGLQLGYQLVEHGHVVAVAEAVDEAQSPDVRLLHQVLQLVTPVGGVHGHGHDPDLGGGEEQGEPIGDVGGPNTEVVAFDETDGQQTLGERIHTTIELRVGESQVPVGIDDEFLVGVARNLGFQHPTDGVGDVFHQDSFRDHDGAYTTAKICAGRSPPLCTLWATMLS